MRRSRAGENWNALSLRIFSTSSLSASRCLVPEIGTIGSRPSLSPLWSRWTDWPPMYPPMSAAALPYWAIRMEKASRFLTHDCPSFTALASRSFSSPARQVHPLDGELARVLAEVPHVHLRVVRPVHVVVGGEGQVGLGGAGRDLLQFGLFVVIDGPVRVLDRPVVVGADGRRVVIPLLLAPGGDVDRRILHDAADQALLARDLRVVQLLRGQHGAGLEVMAKSERVPDLVHDDLLDPLADEFLGQALARPGLARIGDRQGREAHLVLHPAGILAAGMAARRDPTTQLGLQVGPIGRTKLGPLQAKSHRVRQAETAASRRGSG